MKIRTRRWYCRAFNLWPFGDVVVATDRRAAREKFFQTYHVYPFDISPA